MANTNEKEFEIVAKCAEDFTLDFHKNVAGKTEGNFVSSALSAHVVLSMAAYGAEGNTGKEMRQALHLPETDEKAYQGFQNFIDTLNNVQKVILKVANKIYASNTITVKDKFKEITGSYFRSESEILDFTNANESAKVVNNWCVDKTNGKIDKIVEPGDVTPNTGMILLNAVYFKGNWKDKFNVENTKLKPFHVNKTTTVDVPTMYIKEKFPYTEIAELNADCITLPYENEDLVMAIIVPKEIDGLEKIEKNLDKITADHLKSYKREVCLSLPKFKVETTIDLNDHLSELGMQEMFQNNANFKGISDQPLKVGKVRQKAFIEVNEEGSEAAAVTGMMMTFCSMPLPPFEVHVDKPFVYRIMYKDTTLFSGRVQNPLDA